jgi:hypothetical protein
MNRALQSGNAADNVTGSALLARRFVSLVKAVNTLLGGAMQCGNAGEATRTGQALSAAQAGSYCRTEEPGTGSQGAASGSGS